LPSRWWWSSWSVSAGMFFLELFCGGIVSFFGWHTVGANVGGIRKFGWGPRTRKKEQ
jgi:hypothetical protein